MDILVAGGGGREHAIIWSLSQSPKVGKIYCAPGNAGIAQLAECVPIGVFEFDRLTAFAKEKEVGLVVIGPDDPLAGALWMLLKHRLFQCLVHVRMQLRSKAAKPL